MFLRATRIQTPPDKVGAAIDNFETNIAKGLRSAPGNQGVVLLVDRNSGAALGVTYWESAKTLSASELRMIVVRRLANPRMDRQQSH